MLYSFQQGLHSMPPKRDLERRILLLPIGDIRPNPHQPRRTFDRESLLELVTSIAQVGLIQPLLVRATTEGYELVAGERRLRACRMLDWREVPCILQTMDEEQSAFMAIAENLQRSDLDCFEEAECYRRLLDTFALTQEALSARLGKSQAFLSNKLRLLQLSERVRSELGRIGLTERHARALLKLKDERQQLLVLSRIERNPLTVAQTERMIAKMLAPDPQPLRVVRIGKDCRMFINSVKTCIAQLSGSGIRATLEEHPNEHGLELVIRLRTDGSDG